MKYFLVPVFIIIFLTSCKQKTDTAHTGTTTFTKDTTKLASTKIDHQLRQVHKATIAPDIDGKAADPAWEKASWHPIDERWLGGAYTPEDFTGRYKLIWTPEALYILAEITDDVLYDREEDPLTLWWDDDCLEIFIDADNSGGGHQFTHNAFAYHVALDGNVVDIAPGEVPTLYNSHVISERQTMDKITTWECKLTVYDDTYKDGQVNDQKVLKADQKLGFALAYCDNDASKERENFIGSVAVDGEDKNRGWIDAGIFGTIKLAE